jgi:phytoene synthase
MNKVNPHKKSTFGAAFLFLSKDKKTALEAVYAFCRVVDDIADTPNQNPQQKLNEWKREIDFLYQNKPETAIGKNLLPHIKKFNLKKEHFLLIIEGVKQDLTKNRYTNISELGFYMYRVASAVGFLCVDIFSHDNNAKEYAKYTGYAVQLTNIIRDIAIDTKAGRIYIPLEDLKKFGVTEREILQAKFNEKIRKLVQFETQRAKDYYVKAKSLLPVKEKGKMLPARIMGSLYEHILDKIISNDFDVFGSKIKLTKLEKILAVIKAVLKN